MTRGAIIGDVLYKSLLKGKANSLGLYELRNAAVNKAIEMKIDTGIIEYIGILGRYELAMMMHAIKLVHKDVRWEHNRGWLNN